MNESDWEELTPLPPDEEPEEILAHPTGILPSLLLRGTEAGQVRSAVCPNCGGCDWRACAHFNSSLTLVCNKCVHAILLEVTHED